MTTIEHASQSGAPLSRASTIPKRFYLDPVILEAEKERIFGRAWQLVARADDLQRVGDFVPVGVLDEPVVITRSTDGELRAFYDVYRMRLVERRDYVVECNWKVYVDNYLEGYHLPIAHPQLFKEVDYDAYRIETFRWYSKQHAPIRELKPGQELGVDRRFLRQPGVEDSALYYWLFP